MTAVQKLGIQLEQMINKLPHCYTTKNRGGYTLKTKKGVVWGETNRSQKWGKAVDDGQRFYVAIDFPSGSYTKQQLSESTSLLEKEEGSEISGFRMRTGDKFDTIQISIYGDQLNTYSFEKEKILQFIQETAAKASN